MYILGEYYSDLALNKICFWHFITMSKSAKRSWNSGPSIPSSTSKKKKYKRNTIVNSRTSGKNHTTGYSQVRWEMIWRFALCVVPTSVLLQWDCMIFKRDTQRPVYTRKQTLLLTKKKQLHQFRSTINLYTMNVSLYIPFYIIALLSFNYNVQFCACKGDAQNLPLRRVGRGRSPPSSSQRLTGMMPPSKHYRTSSFKQVACLILSLT
jgi:hypothetical protein